MNRSEEEMMKDLMTGAIEGGSNYWYCILKHNKEEVEAVYLCEVPFIDGGFLIIADSENTEEQVKIDKDKILEGWKLFKENYQSHYADVLSDNDDASTADVFFQLVCWGDIIFC